MAKTIDDYSLAELLAAVARKRKAGEKLSRGREKKHNLCKYCNQVFGAEELRAHWPKCPANPLGKFISKSETSRRVHQRAAIRRQAEKLLQSKVEVFYRDATASWYVRDKNGITYLISGTHREFTLEKI